MANDSKDAVKNTVKDRLINGLINLAVLGILGSAVLWLIRFYYGALLWPTEIISLQLKLNWWMAFTIVFFASIILAYLSGNYSLIDLMKWRSKKKGVKKTFFSIRLKHACAVGHSEALDGHVEGYVTKCYLTNQGIRYNALIFLSGWTVLSRLREDEFVRTNKTWAQLSAYYASGGREYVDDEEIDLFDNGPVT